MTSFQIGISPSRRAAGRFVSTVRRKIQQALAEEQEKTGTTQADIARTIGVHRSVISREIQGVQDMTLGRVAEIAWALNRKAILEMPEITRAVGSNLAEKAAPTQSATSNSTQATLAVLSGFRTIATSSGVR